MSTRPLALFGPRFQRLARWLFRPKVQVLFGDRDEGLLPLRQHLFPKAYGLLDRWHLSQAVRAFTGPDQAEFRGLMQPLWHADSRAALQTLSTRRLRPLRPQAWQILSGYLSGHREGIEAWRRLPVGSRPGRGRRPPPVKSGS